MSWPVTGSTSTGSARPGRPAPARVIASGSATTYFATYRVDGCREGVVPPRPPAQVGHHEDTFRKVDGAWLLATRTTFLPFAGPTERLGDPDGS